MIKGIKTLVAVKNIKGTSFVGVRNYENSKNEISNQTFLVGINYTNLLNNDLKTLTSLSVKKEVINLYTTNDKTIVKKAYNELVNSLIKRTSSEKEKEELRKNNDLTIKLSDSQKEAYISLSKGLKAKDDSLYIYGLCVKKTILKEGNYPTKKSQTKTIIKNNIKQLAKLKELKYKQFKLGKLEELKIQGITI